MNQIAATEAAADLETLMDTITRDDQPVFITRPSGPGVVPISYEEWLRSRPAPEWLESIRAGSKARGLDRMTMSEIDDEIAAMRREAEQANPAPE